MYIFILNTDFLESDKKYITNYIKESNNEISIIDVDMEKLSKFDPSGRIPLEAYLRLAVVDYLPNTLNRVLYLDVDIIINKDIKKLYYEDFNDKMLCAMPIVAPKMSYEDWVTSYDKSIYTFFNSGVLLINLSKWREFHFNLERFSKIYIDICKRLKKAPPYQDQSVLNEAFFDSVKFLDQRNYNHRATQSVDWDRFYNDSEYAAIIHYTNDLGTSKPWVYKFSDKNYSFYALRANEAINSDIHKMHKIWWAYAAETPGYGVMNDEAIARTNEYLKYANRLKEYFSLNKKLTDVTTDRDKWRTYSNTFKSLINSNQFEYSANTIRNVENAFLAKGYVHISIYGDTEITKVLCNILGNNVFIDYVVENTTKLIPGVKIVDRNQTTYPNCDAMLIAEIVSYKAIKEKLEKMKVPFPFFNAAEFIQSLPSGDRDGIEKIKNKIASLNEQLSNSLSFQEKIQAQVTEAEQENIVLHNQLIQIKDDNAVLQKTIAKIQDKNLLLKENVSEIKNDNNWLKKHISEMDENIRQLNSIRVKLTEDCNLVNGDIELLKNSVSYKIGRFITFIPRKIRDLFKHRNK